MNLNSKTTRITETAITTALMAVFAIIGFNIFPIILILYPIPFIIMGVRHGTKFNISALVASSILIGILTDVLTGIFIFLIFGLLSISITFMINKKYRASQILMVSIAVSLICTVISIGIVGYISGVSFLDQMNASLKDTVALQMEIIKDMGFSSYEQSQIKELLKNTVDYMIIVIPATIIISSAFISYINYWVATAILRRLGHKTIIIPRFMDFRLPSNIILGVAVIFIASYTLKFLKLLYYETIFINVVILAFVVFFIQGLAVILYYMNKGKMNKVTRGILVILILISFPFSLIVSLLGLLDTIINFRKIKKIE